MKARYGARGRHAAPAGAYTVELALALPVFLALLFMVLELARAVYLVNTLHEATRAAAVAAAGSDFSDADAMALVRQRALFRSSAGPLLWGRPVTDAHVRIDYLALAGQGTASPSLAAIEPANLPACPANNRSTCLQNSGAASCIRFVRVRICDPADSAACTPVPYQGMLPIVTLPFSLPQATAVVPAESLGFRAGMSPCA